ncbi:SET and MYND domain-containing protein 4-like [Pollicipes pollicipes]|uniref:SET and MYND domain-containing protein 4-like n=1 Tax=Pollicipes pollicipes TaxID=41117 RepID=UPI001884AFD2|nr:SET and MYND domain-containing protein 4-like [Pollicipes pollicipes]XP_037091110.1 SET and MYND domain-containing protein 4-like [Pollicipes pollicipes]
MDGPVCAGPESPGDNAFSTFYDGLCAELRALGVEAYRAEFDALDTDRERVEAVLRLQAAARLRLPAAGATGKSEEQARRFLEMAMNCTDSQRKLVLCNTALQHCPLELAQPARLKDGCVRDLYLAVAINRLWTLYELGKLASGLAEAERLLAEPALVAAVETHVQLLVERARFQTALARRDEAEASVRQALQIVRQLDRQQQAMYAVELGTIRKRLAGGEEAAEDVSQPPAPETPRLFGGPHPRLRRVSAALDLAVDDRRGRMLVANTDIPPGSALIADEPFAWSLHPPRWVTHCQNCCRPADCPLPCPDCASVLFCSESCRSEALHLFHGTECGVLDLLIDPNLGRMALLVFRVLARAGPDTLRLHFEPPAPPAPDAPHDSLSYAAVYSQVTNTADRPMGDVVKRCAVALYLTACLERTGAVAAAERAPTAALALRHLQSCSCNAYEVTELRLAGGGVRLAEFEELGGAVYAAVSLANHSCFPNAVRASHGRRLAVTSTRPLRAGDELLDNYGFHFHEEDETSRYAALRRQYQFACECAACEQGWPLYAELTVQRQSLLARCIQSGGNVRSE